MTVRTRLRRASRPATFGGTVLLGEPNDRLGRLGARIPGPRDPVAGAFENRAQDGVEEGVVAGEEADRPLCLRPDGALAGEQPVDVEQFDLVAADEGDA